MSANDAYEEGCEAAELDWVSEQSCPYPVFSKEYTAWHKGFYDSRNADLSLGREA